MELFRALATLAEPPTSETVRMVELLGLDVAPNPATHTDLFVFQQPPYASACLSDDGMIGGEVRDRIAGFWRVLGVAPPPEPDHLVTLLGFYAGVCEQAAAEEDASRREALTRARRAFLWEHLLSWLPLYLHGVRRHAPPPFPMWAELLLDALIEDARELGGAVVLPLHLRDVPALVDPRDGDARQFVDGLLVPARSGMMLTRADLARAARALDIGVRAGERKVALKNLLEHDAPAALDWIASEAKSWQQSHESLVDATGPLAGFWAHRAGATASLVDALGRDAVLES